MQLRTKYREPATGMAGQYELNNSYETGRKEANGEQDEGGCERDITHHEARR